MTRLLQSSVFVLALALLGGGNALAARGPLRYEMPPPRTAEPVVQHHLEPYAPPTRETVIPSRTVKIALLVPLTGQFASLGKAMQDAATMALFDKYESVPKRDRISKVELLPLDSGDSSDMADAAAREAVKEGASIILGPVFSNQVGAVVTHARQRDIPIVSFSNNPFIAGPSVFIFGFIPDQQVRRVTSFAVSHGINRIAALLPSNPYGASVIKPLSETLADSGFSVRPTSYYPDNSTELGTPLKHLLKEAQQSGEMPQALFIAEGSARLPALQKGIVESKINGLNLVLLGTGMWDSPEVLKYPALSGGLFATAPQERYQEFARRFGERFHYYPERRASLVYDAAALAATLALNPAGPDYSLPTLTNPVGFVGPANGIFRLLPDGTNERALSVLQITPRGFKTVDPAPESFLK